MKFRFIATFLSFLIFVCELSGAQETANLSSADEFEFYLSELVENSLPSDAPMLRLITERLAISVFDSLSEDQVKMKLSALQQAARDHPDRIDSFRRVHRLLDAEFRARVKKAKQKRWFYAAGGSVIGALIAVPAGKLLKQSIWLSVPVGILSGGSAGFLLGHLVEVPSYELNAQWLSSDVMLLEDELFSD
jgi:hypothetical protein